MRIFGFRRTSTPAPSPKQYFVHGGHAYKFHPYFPHETYLFRDKMIEHLPGDLVSRFPNGVNIICHAASLGHEPYSLAAKLVEVVGSVEEVKKKYPISAFDVEPELIDLAKDKKLIILPGDVEKSWKTTYPLQRAFVNPALIELNNNSTARDFHRTNLTVPLFTYNVSDELSSLVEFNQANILDHVNPENEIYSKPTVVLFRNAWYCLPDKNELAKKLEKALQPGSIVVVGESENDEETHFQLAFNGFNPLYDEAKDLFGSRPWFSIDTQNYRFMYERKTH